MQEKISRRSFVKDVAKTAGVLYVASQVRRYLDAAYRLLPKPAEEIARVGGDVVPAVYGHSGDILPTKQALVIPDSEYVGFKNVDALKRTKAGDEFEKQGGVITDEYSGVQMIDMLKNPKYASAGAAKFGAVYDVDTSRLYLVFDRTSQLTESNGDIANIYFDTNHDGLGKTAQKDDLGIYAGIHKKGYKQSWFAYGGLSGNGGFPVDWAMSPATVRWSVGLGQSPNSDKNHQVIKIDAPLTLINPNQRDTLGIALAVGNYSRNQWLTFPQREVYGDDSTWGDVPLPTEYPYVGEKIDISPALIIPDCSRAEYVPVDELELTELGKHLVEEEGWKLENEWSDTREVKLVNNIYNKATCADKAYFRAKDDQKNTHFILDCPSVEKANANYGMLLLVDTKYQNDYYPQAHNLLFNMYLDAAKNKQNRFSRGNGRDWLSPYGQTPPEITCSMGFTSSPHSERDHLIFKGTIPRSIINPDNLLKERMAVVLGDDDTELYISYPQNEAYKVSYTWADTFYLPQTQAVPEFGSIHVPGIGRIDVKDILFPATVGILTAILLRIKKASPHSHKQPSISSESYSVL
jgi:hypothetical protein